MAGGVSPWLVLTVVVVTAVFFLIVVAAAVRAMRRQSTTGAEGLIGRLGRAKSDLNPEGVVTLDGELWRARAVSADVIASDSTVRVVAQEDLKLRVERTEER
jgi:membrane-bound serine protease (ClpP class)